MSDFKINNITNRSGDGGPVIAGVSTVSTSAFMIMPSGDTEIRGAGSGRGIVHGNYPAPSVDEITKIEIATRGNAVDFGDSTVSRLGTASFGSSTRGIFAGGQPGASPYYIVDIDYVVTSSGGGAVDFGSLQKGRLDFLDARRGSAAGGNDSTRGLIAGGNTPGDGGARKSMDFVTMASTGDSSDFGELIQERFDFNGSVGNGVRAIFAGGYSQTSPAATFFKIIETVNVQTGGGATKFGEMSDNRGRTTSTSNSTRGLVGMSGGTGPTNVTNIIEYITLSTEGNVTDFGDLVHSVLQSTACSSSTRGLIMGGQSPVSPYPETNIIQFVTIATTGNATDFGDLVTAARHISAASDVNGGLG